MNNIEKLKTKVDKDPTSTLFVPLADAYRKEGRLDEAVEVLQVGIERQPGYMSAKVSLGKIYLEKEMKLEARREFLQVVEVIPDNLFAHTKLAEIYWSLGETDKAVSQYEIVIKLNPYDEKAQIALLELRNDPATDSIAAPAEEPRASTFVEETAEEAVSAAPEATTPIEETAEETAAEAVSAKPEEEVVGLDTSDDWSEGLEVEEEESILEQPEFEDSEFGGIPVEDAPEEGAAGVSEPGVQVQSPVLEEQELAGMSSEAEPVDESQAGGIPLDTEAEEQEASASEIAPEPVVEPEPVAEVTVKEAEPVQAGQAGGESSEVREPALVSSPEAVPSLSEADSAIESSQYKRAIDIYSAHLSVDPENVELIQRIEELKALLDVVGENTDDFQSRLQSFLDGVMRRRDEFFRST